MNTLNASQLLQTISGSDKKLGKLLKYVKTQGLSDDEIAAYLSGEPLQGGTTTQKGEFERKKKTIKNLTNVLDFVKAGAKVASLGFGAYGLYNAGKAAYGALQAAGGLGGLLGGNPQNTPPNTPGPQPVPQGTGPQPQQPQAPQQNPQAQAPQKPTLMQQLRAANTPQPGQQAQAGGGIGQAVQTGLNTLQSVSPFLPPQAQAAIAVGSGLANAFLGREAPKGLAQSFLEQRKELASKTQGAALPKLDQEEGEPESLQGRAKDLEGDLKSAVIRRTIYSPKTKRLRVIFNNDATYVYSDVPEEIATKLMEGGIAAKTSGKNEFGSWWVGKDPSVGASFNKLIKQGGYGYEKVANTSPSVAEKKEYASLSNQQKREQVANSKKTQQVGLSKISDLETIRNLPPKQRSDKIIDWIENRLKEGKTSDKIAGKSPIKKLLTLLPVSIVKTLKNKIDTLDEKDILNFVKEYLTKSK